MYVQSQEKVQILACVTKLATWILVNLMTILKNVSPGSYLGSRILPVNVFQVHFLSFPSKC